MIEAAGDKETAEREEERHRGGEEWPPLTGTQGGLFLPAVTGDDRMEKHHTDSEYETQIIEPAGTVACSGELVCEREFVDHDSPLER